MKARWWNLLLIALFVPLLFLLPILRHFEKQKDEESAKTNTLKERRDPVCLLTGDIRDTRAPVREGLAGVGNIIRLYLDAETLPACKFQFQGYCKTQIAPHPELVPNLRAFFRDKGEETRLEMRDGCMISEVDRNQP